MQGVEHSGRQMAPFRCSWRTWLAVAILLVCAGLTAYALLVHPGGKADGANAYLQVGSNRFEMLVASSLEEQERGLGGRDNLPADQVMVFPYDEPQDLCFWMKDMRFAIDMVWLDADKNVLAVERNVAPQTYPKSYCHRATYVLEFRSGEAAKAGLQPGQKVQFSLDGTGVSDGGGR